MDFSKTFQKMCDCPEIQEERINKHWGQMLQYGDYFCYRGYEPSIYTGEPDTSDLYDIWIPRQDQLQAMIHGNDAHYGLIGRLYWWCRNMKQFYDPDTNSMEQLWLAFVMKEKHGKVWDGETWQKSQRGDNP